MTPDPTLTDASCYCVCHSDLSSRPSCGHCRPAPTDDELAGIDRCHSSNAWGRCSRCEGHWPCATARLIAALRASRAEVERLRPLAEMGQAVVDHAQPPDEFIAAAERFCAVVSERNDAWAEAERLRVDNTELERMFEAAERLCARCGRELEASHPTIPSIRQIPTPAPRHSSDVFDSRTRSDQP